jgi:type I restriction-modification system DNA methylase subunit
MSKQTNNKQNDTVEELKKQFNICLNILRDNEHFVGDKALKVIAYLLDLKLLEKEFNSKRINIDDYDYDLSNDYEEDEIEEHKKKLLKFARFSNLAKEKEDNLTNILKYLWDDLLSKHPITKNIFIKGNGFEIKNQKTYKKIINIFASINFDNIENDILGEAYELVIKDVMIGKTLGQFFTPPNVKKLMVNLVNPKINEDGTTETIFDPAMGTGGFLITSIRHFIQQSKDKKIKLNWDIISKKLIGGREAVPETYQLAVSNMLISSGHMFDTLECGDSIREPITKQYDNILANPPFGIKGLKYDELPNSIKKEYVPIKSNAAVSLFIQAIISMLKINGKCAVVLPDGQDLFNKSNKSLIAIREYLMKTCELKKIIYLPAGIFTYTSIKTCIFYFVKKKEGKYVLNVDVKYSSTTNKETKRTNTFVDDHQTKHVKFYKFDDKTNEQTLLVKVPIKKIAGNSYSLNCNDYIVKEPEPTFEETVVFKKIGDVCDFQNGKNITKEKLVEGAYYVIGGGQKPMGNHNKYNRDENTILCSSSGAYAGYISKYNTKIWASDCFSVVPKNDNMNNNYLYNYLKYIQNDIYKLQSGSAQPHVYPKNVCELIIPVPSLDYQNKIVNMMDLYLEKTNKQLIESCQSIKKQINKYFEIHEEKGYYKQEKLGDVCDFQNGTTITKEKLKDGLYKVIGGGQVPMGKHNKYNRDENTILCSSSGAYAGFISKYNTKIWASDCFSIIPSSKNLNNKYLYYFLKEFLQKNIYKNQSGTAQPHVYSKDILELEIPVPSLERQKEMVEYCEGLEKAIEVNKELIEQNKTQAVSLLKMYFDSCPLPNTLPSSTETKENDEEEQEGQEDKKTSKSNEKSIKVIDTKSESEDDENEESNSENEADKKKKLTNNKKVKNKKTIKVIDSKSEDEDSSSEVQEESEKDKEKKKKLLIKKQKEHLENKKQCKKLNKNEKTKN